MGELYSFKLESDVSIQPPQEKILITKFLQAPLSPFRFLFLDNTQDKMLGTGFICI